MAEKQDETLYFNLENRLLNTAMLEIESTEDGKIQIGDKSYTKVSKRLQVLRQKLGFNVRIDTKLLHLDEKNVVAKAEVSVFKNDQWFPVSTGHAEEKRDDSEINKYSAVENAETSAIGRALAGMGLSGDEYASLEEMVIAGNKKAKAEGESSVQPKKKDEPSKTMLDYFRKLLHSTGTEIEEMLKYYKVKQISEMTGTQVSHAIDILKRKQKRNKTLAEIPKDEEYKRKQAQEEALNVLNENASPKAKTFVSYDLDEDDSPRKEVIVKDEDIMIDDEDDSETSEEKVEETESKEKDLKDSESEEKDKSEDVVVVEDTVEEEKATDESSKKDDKEEKATAELESEDKEKETVNKGAKRGASKTAKGDKKSQTKGKSGRKGTKKETSTSKSAKVKKDEEVKDSKTMNPNAGKNDLTNDDDIPL